MESLTIRAFRAMDEPGTCALFVREHIRVLEDFGITMVASNNASWITDPNTYLIVAEHPVLGMVGGARINVVRTAHGRLPIEEAIGKLDPAVRQFVQQLSTNGVAEICGLWNASRFAGRSLPLILVMVGISLANQLDVGAVVGLAAKYTLKYAMRLGMSVSTGVGNEGWFTYPKPGFHGIVMSVLDPYALSNALPSLRRRMVSLRMRPDQRVQERTGTAILDIDYALRLPGSIVDMAAYRSIQQNYQLFTA